MLLRKISDDIIKNSQSLTIQFVQEQVRTAAELSKTSTSLHVKRWTHKPVWIAQWPLTTEKLQASEQRVEEQLNHHHIEV